MHNRGLYNNLFIPNKEKTDRDHLSTICRLLSISQNSRQTSVMKFGNYTKTIVRIKQCDDLQPVGQASSSLQAETRNERRGSELS